MAHYFNVTLNVGNDAEYEDIEFELPEDATVQQVLERAVSETDETVEAITSAVITVVFNVN